MLTIRWFPASWLLIQFDEKVIYLDPAWVQRNFTSFPGKVIYTHYPEPMDGLPSADLPKADVILVTHHHQDHVKTATINRLATADTQIFAPEKCAELIAREYKVVEPGDLLDLGWLKIKTTFAYNTPEGHSTRKVHHKGEGVGYLITLGSKTIYHAGDTDVIPEMKELSGIDVAFLPVGGTFTMDIQEAVEAISIIKPKKTVPMHFLNEKPENLLAKLANDFERELFSTLPKGGTIEL